jgi:hypothetical protein
MEKLVVVLIAGSWIIPPSPASELRTSFIRYLSQLLLAPTRILQIVELHSGKCDRHNERDLKFIRFYLSKITKELQRLWEIKE